MKISLIRSDKSDVRFLLLLSVFFAAIVFPSRRFTFSYGLGMKSYYLMLTILGLIVFLRNRIKNHFGYIVGFATLLVGFSLNSLSADYRVCATSGLDSVLAAFAIAYLFYVLVKTNFIGAVRAIGLFLFAMTFFSLWVYVGSEPPFPFVYNWAQLWENTFGRPFRFLQIFSRARCNHYPFEYSNFTGIFATLVLPFFTGLFFYDLSKKWKIFWFISLLLGVVQLITADSRAAYLLVLFGMTIGVGLYIQAKAKFSFRQIFFAVSIVSFFTLAVILSNNDLKFTFGYLLKGDIGSIIGIRWNLTQEGWRLFLEKPLTGHGIDTTGLIYFKSLPKTPFPSWQFHSPIQYFVDWGLIGVFGLLMISLSVVHMWYRLFFKTQSRDKILATGCFISFVLYALFVSDWSLNIFGICVSLCLIITTLVFLYKKHFLPTKQRFPIGLQRGIKCLAVILFAQLLIYSGKDIRARYFFNRGASKIYDVSKTEALINKAIEIDPKNHYYYNQLGNIFALHASYSKSAQEKAVHYFKRSLEINPYQIYPLENLGALHTIAREYAQAYEYYFKAVCLNPRHSLAYIQMAHILYLNRFNDLGDQWAALACFANPKLVQCAPLTYWLEENEKIKSHLFQLYQQATVASTPKEREYLKVEELFLRHLAGSDNSIKFLELINSSEIRIKRKMAKLLCETNLKRLTLQHVHRHFGFMYGAHHPFAYPEDIIFTVPEKIRMQNLEGPTLNIYTPCPIYFHPKLINPLNFAYSYDKNILKEFLKEIYKNPFL